MTDRRDDDTEHLCDLLLAAADAGAPFPPDVVWELARRALLADGGRDVG